MWQAVISSKDPAACAGNAAMLRRASARWPCRPSATTATTGIRCFSIAEVTYAGALRRSVACRLLDRLQHVGCLRKDHFFQIRAVGDGSVECGDAFYGRVEVLEQLFTDTGRDFGAKPAGQLILVRDHDAV